MKNLLLYATLALSLFAIFTTTSKFVIADKGCDLPGEKHGDWNPSSHKFYQMVYHASSLCEIAICVDKGDCSNHDKVDWEKFQQSPAYKNADDEEKEALQKAQKHGNGANGLVGYEFLDYVIHDKD